MPRGGKRIGAGAKPHTISEGVKKNLETAIEKVAKETGQTWEEILARILVKMEFKEGRVGIREWLTASSMYLNAMVEKSSHKKIEQHLYDHRVAILPPIEWPKDEEMPKA